MGMNRLREPSKIYFYIFEKNYLIISSTVQYEFKTVSPYLRRFTQHQNLLSKVFIQGGSVNTIGLVPSKEVR